jgi:hypothetical protein
VYVRPLAQMRLPSHTPPSLAVARRENTHPAPSLVLPIRSSLRLLNYPQINIMIHRCNCRCCRSTNNLECTVSCPTCYTVDLQLSYMTRNRHLESNITYQQDFQKDQASANSFQQRHQVDTTTQCYYNPSNIDQVCIGLKLYSLRDDHANDVLNISRSFSTSRLRRGNGSSRLFLASYPSL